MAPHWYDVLLGCAAVVAGCLAASAGIRNARRTDTRWGYAVALGATTFVAGVAGQRSFPTAEQVRRLGSGASSAVPGPWDAGVGLPGLGIHMTPVALVGLFICLFGFSLILALVSQGGASGDARSGAPRDVGEDDTA